MALEPLHPEHFSPPSFQQASGGGSTADDSLECYDKAHQYRILIVDDEASILQSLLRCFRGFDYVIDCFQSPIEALASAKHHAYQVVVSDQRMPQMSGLELLEEVHFIQPETVNIVLSGLSDSDTLLTALNTTTIFRYLLKPWDNAELHKTIRQALTLYEERTETQRLADKARVNNGSMTKHRAYLRDLESKYPGITHVERDENGAIILHPRYAKGAQHEQVLKH